MSKYPLFDAGGNSFKYKNPILAALIKRGAVWYIRIQETDLGAALAPHACPLLPLKVNPRCSSLSETETLNIHAGRPRIPARIHKQVAHH